eukprot:scaffold329659_cov54-Tisochrysis_lutea.AAC.1
MFYAELRCSTCRCTRNTLKRLVARSSGTLDASANSRTGAHESQIWRRARAFLACVRSCGRSRTERSWGRRSRGRTIRGSRRADRERCRSSCARRRRRIGVSARSTRRSST